MTSVEREINKLISQANQAWERKDFTALYDLCTAIATHPFASKVQKMHYHELHKHAIMIELMIHNERDDD